MKSIVHMCVFCMLFKRQISRFFFLGKCDYFWDFSKTKTISNSNPCQNRPTECSECKNLVRSYNMKEHYRISHPEIQTCPHEISQEEIKKVLQS